MLRIHPGMGGVSAWTEFALDPTILRRKSNRLHTRPHTEFALRGFDMLVRRNWRYAEQLRDLPIGFSKCAMRKHVSLPRCQGRGWRRQASSRLEMIEADIRKRDEPIDCPLAELFFG